MWRNVTFFRGSAYWFWPTDSLNCHRVSKVFELRLVNQDTLAYGHRDCMFDGPDIQLWVTDAELESSAFLRLEHNNWSSLRSCLLNDDHSNYLFNICLFNLSCFWLCPIVYWVNELVVWRGVRNAALGDSELAKVPIPHIIKLLKHVRDVLYLSAVSFTHINLFSPIVFEGLRIDGFDISLAFHLDFFWFIFFITNSMHWIITFLEIMSISLHRQQGDSFDHFRR